MIFSRPTKRDLKLLENLSLRGVLQADMINIIDCTQVEFEKWKLKPEVRALLELRPKVSPEKFTINHPDLAEQTEFAFEVGLKRYYRMKTELRLPTGRYKYYYKFLQENSLTIDVPTLTAFLDEIVKCLSGKKGNIELGDAIILLHKLKARIALPFDPELARKLAAVSFFTDDEDLSTYDDEIGKAKIEHWRAHNFHDFFLMMPVGELLNLNGISIESLEEYLNSATSLIRDLTLDPSTLS